MTPEMLRYSIYKLPVNWTGVSWEDVPLKDAERTRLKNAFSIVRPGAICYVQGSAAPIIDGYVKQGLKVRGVDAKIYLDDPFNKVDDKPSLPKNVDVICIYNCSSSLTQQQYVKKILENIIKECLPAMLVICDNLTQRAFSLDYYTVNNSCKIPEKEEETWL